MSKADDLQTAINRASLMMQVDNDVAKAVQIAEIHPALAMVIMTMHHQQHAMNEEINALRKNMMQLAQVIDLSAMGSLKMMDMLNDINARIGGENINPEE